MKYIPHDYQTRAKDFILEHPKAGMLLEMGLGKTVITLTAIDVLINELFEVDRVLVIAPKRVAEDTWTREHAKWDHLRHLRVSKVLGSPEQRRRALAVDADIYVIGRDNVVWLVEQCRQDWPFGMVVIDELSSFKNPQAKRFRALKKVIPKASRVVGLTGTPSANGLMDLWAEIYLLDRGERLGHTLGAYREKYFRPGARNGYVVFKWEPLRGSREKIEAAISDICISMSADDYLTLPKRIDNLIPVKLSPQEMKQYKTMEAEQLLHIDDEDVVALNAAAVMTKLLQIANGSVYSHEGNVVRLHDAKLEALLEIIDTTDSPVLIFYSYKHDLAAIKAAIPGARTLDGPEDIAEWNAGRVQVLLAHPASVGYGLNLQEGGHVIVWYGLTWSLELYQQAKPVIIHHLIAEGTVDEQVMRALQEKDMSQAALMAALKERRTQ
jgi:SNF2 family DNA or RNA helicase